MAIGQCQPPYLSGTLFIDSDRSLSREQLTKEHLLLVLTFISLRSSWPRRAWRVWRLPKDKPPEEGLGLRLFLFLLWQLLDFVAIIVLAVVIFCCYYCYCSCQILLLWLFLLLLLLQLSFVVALAVVIFCCYYCLWQTSWGRPGVQVVLIFVVVLVVNLCCCWCQPGTQVVCIQT